MEALNQLGRMLIHALQAFIRIAIKLSCLLRALVRLIWAGYYAGGNDICTVLQVAVLTYIIQYFI